MFEHLKQFKPTWVLLLWLLTIGWIGMWVIIGLNRDFPLMRLNEMGDLMAGVFAPVALAWFIVGVHSQREEMKKSVAALEEQSRLARHSAQSDHFESWLAKQPDLKYNGRGSIPRGMEWRIKVLRADMRDVVVECAKLNYREESRRVSKDSDIHLPVTVSIKELYPIDWIISYADETGHRGRWMISISNGSISPTIILQAAPPTFDPTNSAL